MASGFIVSCASGFVARALEATALVRLVGVMPSTLGRSVPVFLSSLHRAVDVYLAGLIGRVVVAIAVLERPVDAHPSLLDRGVRVLGLCGRRGEHDCQHGTRKE